LTDEKSKTLQTLVKQRRIQLGSLNRRAAVNSGKKKSGTHRAGRLPPLSRIKEEIENAVAEVIAETGASSI